MGSYEVNKRNLRRFNTNKFFKIKLDNCKKFKGEKSEFHI